MNNFFATKQLPAVVLLFVAVNTFAGDIDRAFKALNAGDYVNANKYLREVIAEEPENVAANYGMAKYFYAKDNPVHQVDSANYFIKRAAAKMPLNEEDKQNKKYLALGVRDFTISALLTDINQEAYAIAERAYTVESFQHFVDNYTAAGFLSRATTMRNQLAYIRARAKGTPEAIKEFMEKYPKAEEVKDAESLYDKTLYEKTTADQSYLSYKKYIDSYPNGAFIKEAKKNFEEKVFEHYTGKNDLAAYAEFINLYPEHPAYNNIQDSIYKLATKAGTVAAYKNFIAGYKSNRNINNAWEQLYLLYTSEATEDVYRKFMQEFPDVPDKERVLKDLKLSALDLKPFPQGDKWGYAYQPTKDSLAVIIPAEFEEAYEFSCGYAAVRVSPCTDEKCTYFYIDKGNQRAFPVNFNFAGNFDKGYAVVGVGNCETTDCKYGIIDKRGVFVTPATYQEINDQTEGLYLAMQDDKYGYINSNGEEIISFRYTDALPFSMGVAGVAIDDHWFFINKDGGQLFIHFYSDVSSFSDSLCAVKFEDGDWGYIDMAGNYIIEPAFDAAENFENGFAIVSKREPDPKNKSLTISQRYRIDKKGKIVEKLTAPKEPAKKSSRRKSRK